ncbi:hypothetical protein BS17DRAFT_711952 [Gyrodon lividus]|nr:hypothetical protein BS17DRAFT_711952 [Gyrodon lividus]
MPMCGTHDTPKFSGKIAAHLLQYLEDINILGDSAQIMDEAKIKAAIRYVDLEEAEVWQTLPKSLGTDWDTFVAAVKDLYPGCKGADCYCHMDLQYLVQDYCAKAMHTQDDLGEYCRRFLKVSSLLILTKKLVESERNALLLNGFPKAIKE